MGQRRRRASWLPHTARWWARANSLRRYVWSGLIAASLCLMPGDFIGPRHRCIARGHHSAGIRAGAPALTVPPRRARNAAEISAAVWICSSPSALPSRGRIARPPPTVRVGGPGHRRTVDEEVETLHCPPVAPATLRLAFALNQVRVTP